jgi:hypothetical protein
MAYEQTLSTTETQLLGFHEPLSAYVIKLVEFNQRQLQTLMDRTYDNVAARIGINVMVERIVARYKAYDHYSADGSQGEI